MITLVILLPMWGPGYPLRNDSWGHVQRAAMIGDNLRQFGLLEGINRSAWMPAWYMGTPTNVYYPPLSTWVLGLLSALVSDPFVAFRLFVTGTLLALGLSVYVIGMRWGQSRWLAAIGAIMAVTAPYTLRTIFVEGNLGRALSVVLLPWLIWHTERLLSERDAHFPFLWLTGLMALSITAHVMQATIFALLIGTYIVLRALREITIPLRRTLLALLPIGFGLMAAAIYWLPAYSYVELTNVPYLPTAKIDLFVIRPENLIPNFGDFETINVGAAIIVVALVIVLRQGSTYHLALAAVSGMAILLAFGPPSGVYYLLPLNQSLLPERFLNASAVLLPMIVATAHRGLWKQRYMLPALAIVLLVDSAPAWGAIAMRQAPPEEQAVAQLLAERPQPGRVVDLTLPVQTSSQIYLNSVVGAHENVLGWQLENTSHHPGLRRLLNAFEVAPDYLARLLSLWQADYVVGAFPGLDDPAVQSVRQQLGFEEVSTFESLALWERVEPAAFVQALGDNRMLIIGDNATDWLYTFPFATEGFSPDPADYDPAYLDHFSVIGLTRLPENVNIDAALGDWVRAGGTLILDLSGMGDIYGRGYSLFDVQALPMAVSGAYPVAAAAGVVDDLPRLITFPASEGYWVGATYYDLDVTLASLLDGDQAYPLLGYQNEGQGRVWFVGFNLIYLLRQQENIAAVDSLVDLMLAGVHLDRTLSLDGIPATDLDRASTAVRFTYRSDVDRSAVLSMTYFPRWKATIDGTPVPIRNHEHLMLIDLPAGTHTVELAYHPFGTPIALLGVLVSGTALAFTVLAALFLKLNPVVATTTRLAAFEDRVPQVTISTAPRHAPCPNCGFRLAEIDSPDMRSYPFIALECPICGFSVNDTSLQSVEPLSDFEKRRLGNRWLNEQGLSRSAFFQQYGFRVDELFGEPLSGIGQPEKPGASAQESAMPAVEGDIHWVNTLAFNDNGTLLASGGRDTTIRLWSMATGQETAVLQGHQSWVNAVALSPTENVAASGSADHTIRIWNIDSRMTRSVLRGHLDGVTCLAFGPDGKTLVSGGLDRTIRLWRMSRGAELTVLRGHQDAVTCLATSPDGMLVASGSADRTVRLWDMQNSRQMFELTGHQTTVLAVAFSSTSHLLTSVSSDGVINLWSPSDGRLTASFRLEGVTLKSASFNREANLLALVDGNAHLVEAATGQEVGLLRATASPLEKIAFSPDQRTLASADAEGGLRLWAVG